MWYRETFKQVRAGKVKGILYHGKVTKSLSKYLQDSGQTSNAVQNEDSESYSVHEYDLRAGDMKILRWSQGLSKLERVRDENITIGVEVGQFRGKIRGEGKDEMAGAYLKRKEHYIWDKE